MVGRRGARLYDPDALGAEPVAGRSARSVCEVSADGLGPWLKGNAARYDRILVGVGVTPPLAPSGTCDARAA
jgi:hypothetical protein